MIDNSNINWKAMSDASILRVVGEFIKHHRLEQNKTQVQLAKEAGINRSTLSEVEKGNRSTLLTLIQLLRVLNQLHILNLFQVQKQLSPIELAKLESRKRKRASRIKSNKKKNQSDW
jgi:transcriptional regulator with XRE-family HTH domain